MPRAFAAPQAHSQAATPVTENNFTLNGMVVPNGLPTTAWFEWGTNATLNQVTPATNTGGGFSVSRVSTVISNLPAGANFRCRLVASNALGVATAQTIAFTTGQRVTVWGDLNLNVGAIPAGLTNVSAIAAGYYITLALTTRGTVAAWGSSQDGLTTLPGGLTNALAVSAGDWHALALKADGTVVAWGRNDIGQTNVPAGLTNVVAISAAFDISLALRRDGTVAAWGRNDLGQTNVPAGLSNVVEVIAGGAGCLAMKADGTLVSWGGAAAVPADFTNLQSVALGPQGLLAVKPSGAVVASGSGYAVPSGMGNGFTVDCGTFHGMALDETGRVAAWGTGSSGITNVPAGLSNVLAISAGNYHCTALGNLPPSAKILFKAALAAHDIVVTLQGSDPNNDLLNYRIVTLPASGTLYQWTPAGRGTLISSAGTAVTDAGGRIIYNQPAPGTDSFNFTANDGLMDSAAATVSVSISPAQVFTQPAHAVSTTTVNLRGAVGVAVPGLAWFEWGSAGNFGQSTDPVPVPGDGAAWRITSLVSNLAMRANYQCRLVVSNQFGLNYGLSVPFTTGRRAYGWGDNSNGQTNPPASLTNAVFISNGDLNSFAIRADGSFVGWGWGGGGSTTPPAGLTNAVDAAGGWFHTVALKSDGTVMAWGNGDMGQTNVPPGLANVVDVAAGYTHSFALRADGTVAAWGDFNAGQANVPAGLSNVVAIAGGRFYDLALRSDGTVVAWGSSVPVPDNLLNVAAIAAGNGHCLALLKNGTVFAWGSNGSGQTNVPAGLTNIVAIAAGGDQSLALKTDGTIVAWGNLTTAKSNTVTSLANGIGLAAGLGHGLALANSRPQAIQVRQTSLAGLDVTVQLAGYDADGDALQFRISSLPAVGSLYQWTPGGRGALILTNDTPVADAGGRIIFAGGPPLNTSFTFLANDSLADSAVASAVMVVSPAWVATRMPHPAGNNAALLAGTTASGASGLCWFEWGLAGAFTQSTASSPAAADGQLGQFSRLLTGLSPRVNYQCRLAVSNAFGLTYGTPLPFTTGRKVVAWGRNNFGQTNVPSGLVNVVQIAAGYTHSVALKADGTVVAWGSNTLGETNVPAGLTDVVAVDAGQNFSVALKTNGSVIAWGQGSVTNIPSGLSNVVEIAAGYLHVLALKADGSLVAWGVNVFDQFPAGQTNIPAGLSNVVAIAAGGGHNLALKADGTVTAWGYNANNQTTVPPGVTNIVAVAAGRYHSLALRSDGTILGWGYSRFGQTVATVSLVNGGTLSGGDGHSLALSTPGAGAAWGDNTYGQGVFPASLNAPVATSAGGFHNLALGNYAPQATSQTNLGPAGMDSTVTLTATDPNQDALGFRIAVLPVTGTLFQWTSAGRGPTITAPNIAVTDALGRVIFAPVGGISGWPYTQFSFKADDGELLSPAVTVTVNLITSPAIVLGSISNTASGTFSFQFAADTNAACRVLGSTNLSTWNQIGLLTQLVPGLFQFTDTNTSAFPRRFYRVVSP